MLPVGEVVAFQQLLDQYMAESDRWTIMGAAVLINAGCSDDGFDYFRGWLIGQGRAVYEAAVRDPDSLASHPQVGTRDPRTLWPSSLDCRRCRIPPGTPTRPSPAKTCPSRTSPGHPETQGRTGTSTTTTRCADATPGCGPAWAGTRSSNHQSASTTLAA